MRNWFTTFLLAGAVATAPAIAVAAQSGSAQKPATAQTQPAPRKASSASASSHATTGVVKSVDASTLVISRSGHHDMAFKLDPAAEREGAIDVGSSVSVRYREDGKTHVATAITARPAKAAASHTTAAAHTTDTHKTTPAK